VALRPDGNYSLYSEAAAGENYLRGAQEVDAAGTASFTSISPACYSGRWPHVHFEVYASLAGGMVFGDDGGIHQLATMSGDADSGYVAALTIAV
jgi:protocatechuate 3,4-dioxygenase beta subunit